MHSWRLDSSGEAVDEAMQDTDKTRETRTWHAPGVEGGGAVSILTSLVRARTSRSSGTKLVASTVTDRIGVPRRYSLGDATLACCGWHFAGSDQQGLSLTVVGFPQPP